jgi:large subunit ribosomal protein L7/L12
MLQEKPKEKTVFNVKLESFDAAAKPKIIREVKAMIPNLTLIDVRSHFRRSSPLPPISLHHPRAIPNHSSVYRAHVILSFYQAKKFVESLPKVLKENIAKEDAEKLKKVFSDLGGVVVLE